MPPPPEPNNPHDALFRKTFSNVEHAAAELRAVLPSELVSRINFATLELSPGSYVDAELSSSHSDLLFTVEIAGKRGLLYLLFEHQSSVDELMPLRIVKYVIRILEEQLAAAGGGKLGLPLLPIIPVVLHHSLGGWTAPTRLEDLFDPELVALPAIGNYLPRLSFVLDDISHLSDAELTRRALGALPTLTLWALRDARRPGRVTQSLQRWSGLIRGLYEAESGGAALLSIFRYLSLVAQDLSRETLLATLTPASPRAEQDRLMTTLAERWIAEGEAKGRTEGEAKGRTEGEAKGRTEGARRLLSQLLEARFGDLSGAERRRIDDATEDDVLRWSSRVFSADSVAAILAD